MWIRTTTLALCWLVAASPLRAGDVEAPYTLREGVVVLAESGVVFVMAEAGLVAVVTEIRPSKS